MEHLVDNEDEGVVVIGGRIIEGWIDDKACPICAKPRVYYDDFDALFCAYCNKWLESKCDDPTCGYCKKRPETPLT